MKRRDVLEAVRWAEDNFGSLITNSGIHRRDVMRCVRAGLVQSAGPVVVLDDDGDIKEPERYREGFVLTKAGQEAIL